MIRAAILALALAACSRGRVAARAPGPPPAPIVAEPLDAGPPPDSRVCETRTPDACAPLPDLDALAAHADEIAPLMREVKRSEVGEVTLSADADACVRAFVVASGAERAFFEDQKHARRGEAADLKKTGAVPPRGPACLRKGETLRLVVEPAGARARAIVWQAP